MGRLGEVVEYKSVTIDGDKAAEVTVDLGGDDVVTVIDASPAGYFAKPQKGDLAIIAEVDGSEEYAIMGFIDVSMANPAGDGEVYLYSRSSAGGAVARLHLQSTGKVLIENDNAVIELESTGEIKVYNSGGAVTIAAASGDIKLQNSFNEIDLTTAGCLINGHVTIASGQNP